MKKKIWGTVLTLSLAAATVLGNSALVNATYAKNNMPDTQIVGKYEQTDIQKVDQKSVVEISKMEDAPDMAAKRTPEDMNKEQAVELALQTIESKFQISLNGMYATPIFCTLEGVQGNYYFVSFVDAQTLLVDAQTVRTAKSKGEVSGFDVYIAMVNAKTGEVVSAEKNPSVNQNPDAALKG